MKKGMAFLLVLGVFVFVGTNAHALPIAVGDRVKVNSYGPSVFGDHGGEYAMEADNGYTWTTYCIEKHENINPDNWDWVGNITDQAIEGNGNDDQSESGYDSLSDESAWLFWNYSQGSLSGYTTGTPQNEADLQGLLWYLEDEVSDDQSLTSGMQTWLTAANNAVTGGWTNNGNVMVLNLYNTKNSDGTYSGFRQDILISVPDASTMFLLGPALLFLGLLGRRRKKSD